VEYDTIRAVKSAVRIPVIANGDIVHPEQAREVLRDTGADAIMIGRAAQGRPWIFREIRHYLDPGLACRRRWLRKRGPRFCGIWTIITVSTAKRQGVRIARKHLGWYTQELAGGQEFRREVNRLETCAEQLAAVARFFDTLAEQDERLDYLAPAQRSRTPIRRAVLHDKNRNGAGRPWPREKNTSHQHGQRDRQTVEKSLDEYFRKLDGEPPHGIYDMVITTSSAR
jgi:tRNA-dihydrouridine synthase B